MKWIYRLLALSILVGALALPFFTDNQQGDPMLSLPDTGEIFSSLSSMTQSSTTQTSTTPLPSNGTQTVYKWQDAQGVRHYGDTPPSDQKNITKMEVNGNTNIIQSLKTAKPKNDLEERDEQLPPMTPASEDILSFERAANVMNDAKAAAKMMEQRNQALGKIVGDE